MPEAFDADAITSATFVESFEHHLSLGSTNDRARELAAGNQSRGAVLVVADDQTGGRGRGQNRWWTGRGSLAMSLLFDPAQWGMPRELWPRLSLATAVALVDVLAPRLAGRLVGLHWPNDVFVERRKIAGILLEGLPDGRQIAGLGLNVNNRLADAPAELQQIATTMTEVTGEVYDRQAVLVDLLQALDATFRQLAFDPAALGRRFDELCLQHDQVLSLDTGTQEFTGVCRGVALDGALILATNNGQRSFYAGVLRHNRRL